eukprot:4646616-Prorocentrum_lima.AAC.1
MLALTIFHTARTSPFDRIYGGKSAVRGMPRVSRVCCQLVAAASWTGPILQSLEFMRRGIGWICLS